MDKPTEGGTATATPPVADPPAKTDDKGGAPPATPPVVEPPASTSTFKQDDAQPPKPAGAPEKYELVAPKDSTIDSATLERTAATARTLGLSNEQAQNVVDLLH